MAFSPDSKAQVNISVAQSFLCSIDNVLSASVWQRGQTIMARVTVTENATVTETDLQTACLEQIGVLNTPTAILLERRVRPAA